MADAIQDAAQAPPATPVQSTTVDTNVAALQQQVAALEASMKTIVEKLAIHGIYIEPDAEPEGAEPV